jgi:hypothetical protein
MPAILYTQPKLAPPAGDGCTSLTSIMLGQNSGMLVGSLMKANTFSSGALIVTLFVTFTTMFTSLLGRLTEPADFAQAVEWPNGQHRAEERSDSSPIRSAPLCANEKSAKHDPVAHDRIIVGAA